jgi:hypothetical protein
LNPIDDFHHIRQTRDFEADIVLTGKQVCIKAEVVEDIQQSRQVGARLRFSKPFAKHDTALFIESVGCGLPSRRFESFDLCLQITCSASGQQFLHFLLPLPGSRLQLSNPFVVKPLSSNATEVTPATAKQALPLALTEAMPLFSSPQDMKAR